MDRPEQGLTAAVRLWQGQEHDGDTVPLVLPILGECKIRLIDCWAPEKHEPGGQVAASYLKRLLLCGEADGELYCWIPPFIDTDGDGRISLLEMIRQGLSFERIPGRVWVGNDDVSEVLVRAGLATAEDLVHKRRHDKWGRVT